MPLFFVLAINDNEVPRRGEANERCDASGGCNEAGRGQKPRARAADERHWLSSSEEERGASRKGALVSRPTMNMMMCGLLLVLPLALLLSVLGRWALVQTVRSCWMLPSTWLPREALEAIESEAWEKWEDENQLPPVIPASPIPLLLPQHRPEDVDLSRPLLMKGLFDELELGRPDRKLSLDGLSRPPLAELKIDYFTDARRANTVPDAVAPLADIVKNITSGGPQKFGTQWIVEKFPELVAEIALPRVREIFGDRFRPEHCVKPLGGILPALTTVPVFMASGGRKEPATISTTATTKTRPRTDLHCEPIGNVVAQLSGRKRWTLVSPQHYKLLRPAVAPDGRAYFFSRLDPLDPAALSGVPRYEVITERGDGLWVPPWTWHRVDYVEDEVALSASLFHFRPTEFVRNNPLFSGLLVPNLIKELLGVKTQ